MGFIKRGRAAVLLACVVGATLFIAVPAQAATVSVTAGKPTEYKFSGIPSSVKAGTVTFKVKNSGKIPHDFSIGGKTTPIIKPGGSATLKVSLKKGKAAYKCTVPGHAAAGMKGTLTVK
jgi:uncharacterized cupredoxin-like copper-binding protein